MKYDNTKTIESIKTSKYFRPADIGTIIVMLIMIIAMLVIMFMPHGSKVVVSVDGKIKYEYMLDEDREFTVNFDDDSYNVIVIQDGTVFVKSATCKNQVCVETGKISKVGETIACLPHKLIIEIVGENKQVDTTV